MSKYTYIYTDGGPEKWAFVVVEDDMLVYEESGVFGIAASTSNDDTESEAIIRALRYAQSHPANYILITDSQSIIAKIKGTMVNATKNPNIKGIQTILQEIQESQTPVSLSIRWQKRLSNDFMKKVDKLCKKR